MKISLVLVIFSLAQLDFHRLRTPGQLLRLHTVKTIQGQGQGLNLGLVVIPEHTYLFCWPYSVSSRVCICILRWLIPVQMLVAPSGGSYRARCVAGPSSQDPALTANRFRSQQADHTYSSEHSDTSQDPPPAHGITADRWYRTVYIGCHGADHLYRTSWSRQNWDGYT